MSTPTPTHDTLVAKTLRIAEPSWGYCYRCGYPWKFAEEHVTHYSNTSGCFPLCESCWVILGSPEARIEYYKMLIDHWGSQPGYKGAPPQEVDLDQQKEIQRAVANGG